jgi:hypothetical protein
METYEGYLEVCLLHERKGDANLQGFAVTDPLEFQFAERL